MSRIDVSEVLLDPDFMDSLTCYRYSQAVTDKGLGFSVMTEHPFLGVVTSDSGDILDRNADGERIKGTINIHSMFRLTDGSGQDQTADQVLFGGRRYVVSSVNDYSHVGRGFVAATCTLKDFGG